MSTVVEQFQACKTAAEVYRLSIHIENNATPTDIVALRQRLAMLPKGSEPWLENLCRMMFRESAILQRFERHPVAENVCLYSTPRTGNEPRDLLIGFCGLADRLQLPTPAFCQHVDSRQFDLLLVRDTSKRIYVEGVPGYGTSLALVAERLRRDIDLDKYRSVYCLGTSGGGWAALMVGALLRVQRAMAVAGKPPALTPKLQQVWNNSGHADGALNADFAAFERYFTESGGTSTPMLALFGADNPADRESAHALARITGARPIGFIGVSEHNLMFELLRSRGLAAILRRCLLGDLEDIAPASGEALVHIEALASGAPNPVH
jgi:hypothetical protein